MTRKTFLAALLTSAALVLPAMPALAQGGACLSPQQIQEAIANGQILKLAEILAQAGLTPDQVVGQFSVCDRGGQLYYSVPVLVGGDARTISLNAVTGQP